MTQREFATLMGKRESEISRWLTGTHGFTTTTLAKISAILGEPIVEVHRRPSTGYVFLAISPYYVPSTNHDVVVKVKSQLEYRMPYKN